MERERTDDPEQHEEGDTADSEQCDEGFESEGTAIEAMKLSGTKYNEGGQGSSHCQHPDVVHHPKYHEASTSVST